MSNSDRYLSPADAARRLGVSAKALRLYEQRGLIAPLRTAAGWRVYGPDEMERAAEIVALRALGFSLAQVARVLEQDSQGLAEALAAHQASLEGRAQQINATVNKLQRLRDDLASGRAPSAGELARLVTLPDGAVVGFDLPWPWGGERFDLRGRRPLTYVVGPLFSGKTRLARCIAQTLPDAAFLDLGRTVDGTTAQDRLAADPPLRARVERALDWLVEDGAVRSVALVALLAALEADTAGALVVDMIEQDLDAASQRALTAHLRRRGADARPLFALTRSCEILDLDGVGPHEAVIFCPANHAPPSYVAPHRGSPGYEAVATCLASPEVRARTARVIAQAPAG